jgi:hypothetical protein
MKHTFLILAAILIAQSLSAQKSGLQSINPVDLKKHMQFLASDELEGRDTGEPGLLIAARYLAVQAEALGLKAAEPGNSYFQHYVIEEKSYDREHCMITIRNDSVQTVNHESFYVLPSLQSETLDVEGDVVFAGYGIRDEDHGYNDFEGIDIAGKVVLIMNRAPMNEEGTEAQFDNEIWSDRINMRYKLPYIMSKGPKAVLLVRDPKSGAQSIEDGNPRIARYLSHSRGLKEERGVEIQEAAPRTFLVHRSVADQLLEGSGSSLKDLQLEIDRNLESRSFPLEGKHIRIQVAMKTTDLEVPNVFGIIEGIDTARKDEMVLYLAHYDHLGTDEQGGVFNGADDNASGTVALLEIAEAFQKEKKKPGRSVGFLWVSAEEIGLFGSEYFAAHPLIPEDKIAAVINLDMVGRSKTEEDVHSDRQSLTIQGGDTVKVIGALQSAVLMKINQKTLDEMGMTGNYTYNDINHPDRYFYRSDHISFARKDIPVLFYSTGTHADYHTVNDVEEKIDYDKFLQMTRFCYKVGFNVTNYPGSIEVDHPMSGW